MLTTALVQEIDRLLQQGDLSHRQIANQLGVSRGTVNSIANGRRGLYGKEDATDSPLTPATPPTRCPSCGYRVHLPCQICRSRAHKQRQQILQVLTAQRPRNAAAGTSPPSRTNARKKSRAAAQRGGRTKSPA